MSRPVMSHSVVALHVLVLHVFVLHAVILRLAALRDVTQRRYCDPVKRRQASQKLPIASGMNPAVLVV